MVSNTPIPTHLIGSNFMATHFEFCLFLNGSMDFGVYYYYNLSTLNPSLVFIQTHLGPTLYTRNLGTLMTASAHIITSVIGSGVLSLAWATAQLGWIAGPFALLVFALITLYTAALLCDCYRFPGPKLGSRNYSYTAAVKSHLGGMKYKFCGVAQFAYLLGTAIGYTIITPLSMATIEKSFCVHSKGLDGEELEATSLESGGGKCNIGINKYVMVFGIIEVLLSQLPNFHKLAFISVIAALMSFAYATIGLSLCIARIAERGFHPEMGLTGVRIGRDVSASQKVFNSLQAIGDIAFAYSYTPLLLEIQDTLKASKDENEVMKKASIIGVSITTLFYTLCGVVGYAAFGNRAPPDLLTGFTSFKPFWIVDIANLCVVIHLIGAYQVFIQPTFRVVEDYCNRKWPEVEFLRKEHEVNLVGGFAVRINVFRLVWRSIYVMGTCVVGMIFPFFNSVLGLLGALAFWPLTLYFPTEMHKKQVRMKKWSWRWSWVNALSLICLVVSIAVAVGSVEGILLSLRKFRPFHFQT
ncbi:Amino acid permease 8 [Linum grandiflorum]